MFSELNLIAQPNVSFSDSAPIPFASSDDMFYFFHNSQNVNSPKAETFKQLNVVVDV